MRTMLLGRGQWQYRDPSRRLRRPDVGPANISPVAERHSGHCVNFFLKRICKLVIGLGPIMGQNDQRSPIMKAALLLRALTAAVVTAFLAVSPAGAQTLDKVSFGTNWVAEAEHGGFFQAVADGTYKKYGLDVTIVPGGPNSNNRMLLIAGKLDFFMAANTLMSFDAVTNHVPVVAIAAMFQKDPQIF